MLTAIAPLAPDTITARPADLDELFLDSTHRTRMNPPVNLPTNTELIRLDLRLRRRMLIGTAVGAAAYLALDRRDLPLLPDTTPPSTP